MLGISPNLVCNLSIELGKNIASRRIIIDVTLHGVSLKSKSHLSIFMVLCFKPLASFIHFQ